MKTPALIERSDLLFRLLREAGLEHWRGFAVAFALMAVIAAMTGLTAWMMRSVVNGLFVEGRGDLVLPIAGAVALIFTVKGAASYANSVILKRICNAIVARLQRRIFDHALAQPVDFFDHYPVSVMITRLSQNARAAGDAVTLVVTRLGRDLLSVIALGIVMIAQNPTLALVALLGLPPAIWGLNILVRRIKEIARAEFEGYSRIVATVQETGKGLRIVKAFGLERRMHGQMRTAVEGVKDKADAIATVSAAPIPLVETLAGLAIAAVILVAGSRISDGVQDPGAFFAFLTALLLAYEPAKRVAQINVMLHAQLVSVEMMFSLLDKPVHRAERPGAMPLPPGPGRIVFEDVRFRYRAPGKPKRRGAKPAPRPMPSAQAPVPGTATIAGTDSHATSAPNAPPPLPRRHPVALQGLSFVAEAGEVTALVGPSGAGKSTIFQLIERFHDPDAGRISIDGHDIADVTLASLRDRIAYVGQETFLFAGTVAENIALGRGQGAPGIDPAAIAAAARTANADRFIEALPDGYATQIGENGARLSGGQRLRLSIARAVLRDPEILLLDEPTSALDAETEAHVVEALERVMRGRTTLIVAHRLSSIRHARKIHVIDAGRVVQSGTHAALMASGGLYARLHALQFGDERRGEDPPGAAAAQ
ncbi:MAG: ABC transporter ATP-binding protein [Pseudomonadota bacterium]